MSPVNDPKRPRTTSVSVPCLRTKRRSWAWSCGCLTAGRTRLPSAESGGRRTSAATPRTRIWKPHRRRSHNRERAGDQAATTSAPAASPEVLADPTGRCAPVGKALASLGHIPRGRALKGVWGRTEQELALSASAQTSISGTSIAACRSAADEVRHARVPQHVCGKFEPGSFCDAAHDQVNRSWRQPPDLAGRRTATASPASTRPCRLSQPSSAFRQEGFNGTPRPRPSTARPTNAWLEEATLRLLTWTRALSQCLQFAPQRNEF
jgi:hypothetical protein